MTDRTRKSGGVCPWVLGFAACFAAGLALAQAPAPPKSTAPASGAPTCKVYGSSKCCDPKVAEHLSKEAVLGACGQPSAAFLGEKAEKDTCTYYFKVEGEPSDATYVQVFAPMQPSVPAQPSDPFFSYKKMGKVFVLDRAKSPKAQAMIANSMGLWMPGKGYFVSVRASTKVCPRTATKKLAAAMN